MFCYFLNFKSSIKFTNKKILITLIVTSYAFSLCEKGEMKNIYAFNLSAEKKFFEIHQTFLYISYSKLSNISSLYTINNIFECLECQLQIYKFIYEYSFLFLIDLMRVFALNISNSFFQKLNLIKSLIYCETHSNISILISRVVFFEVSSGYYNGSVFFFCFYQFIFINIGFELI